MVFRLAAKGFYAVTYPGRRFADLVRSHVADSYEVPVRTIAVGGSVGVVEIDRMDREAQGEVARGVEGYFELEEGEQLATVIGYEGTDSYGALVAVTLVPFLVLTTLSLLVAMGTTAALGIGGFLWLTGIWVAFSLGAHAFPDWVGSRTLLDRSKERPGVLVVLGGPFGALSLVVNGLRAFRVDALYAIALLILGVSLV